MVSEIYFLGVMGYYIGMIAFLSNRKHLLSMLLSLEYVSLSLFYLLGIFLNVYVGEDYLLMYFLLMVVCEGVLGLSVMVSVVRMVGNDYYFNFNMLKC